MNVKKIDVTRGLSCGLFNYVKKFDQTSVILFNLRNKF